MHPNKLPNDLKPATNVNCFKHNIKKYFLKGERMKFLKNCQVTSYAMKLGQKTFFSIIKLVFQEKREFYFVLL